MQVDYGTIKEAINNGATSVEQVADATGASTACGGCSSQIEEILAEN